MSNVTIKSGAKIDQWVVLGIDDDFSLKDVSSHINTIECDQDVTICTHSLREIITCDCCDTIELTFELCRSPRVDGVGSIFITANAEDITELEGCETSADCSRILHFGSLESCN